MFVIKNDPKDRWSDLVLGLIVIPWLIMLAIGALGHCLNVPFLFRFGFFECLLLLVATFPFRGSGFGRKVIKVEG